MFIFLVVSSNTWTHRNYSGDYHLWSIHPYLYKIKIIC